MKSSVHSSFRTIKKRIRRILSVFLSAYMLGISNVVLEEDRMINDTGVKTEQREVQDEDDAH
ncbi:hypothetical protein [Flagellimonas flava]|uniref:hypothetical protein n=1 Tax=Flagellimonas flava TaxID=570519 RepID=UPI0010423C1A|nr:hypothetical protein [Allomuricauda flava]